MLGPVGRKVGAGQSGGWGYFLEEGESYELPPRVNKDVNMQRVPPTGAAQLRGSAAPFHPAASSPRTRSSDFFAF